MNDDAKKAVGDLFGGHAQLYADARPTYPQELLDYVASLCQLTNRVWDCATGTGQAARPLAKIFTEVFATDVSEKQIAVAEGESNILYSVQASEMTDLESGSFDLVTVAQALHWFDHDRFWREVDRVLKPQGIFAAWGYDWTKIDFDVDFMLQENYFEPLKSYWNPKAKLLWGGYQPEKVNFPYQAKETPKFSIELNWDLNQLFQYFLSWSASQSYIKENGQELILNAKHQVQKIWGLETDKKLIQLPVHLLVGVKE